MANIDEYIRQIEQAEYGEEVRSSIVNALKKVNDDNNSYGDIKKEILNAKDAIDDQVVAFDNKVTAAQSIIKNLTDATSTANQAKTNLDASVKTANTAKSNLENATDAAGTAKTNVEQATSNANKAITNANNAKSNLEKVITSAGTAQGTLQDVINAANQMKGQLDTSNSTAVTAKENLDAAIDEASTAKTQLSEVITNAGKIKTALSEVITQANAAKTNLDNSVKTANQVLQSLDSENTAAASNIEELRSENFNSQEILAGVADLRAYLGLTDDDIVGVQVDYKNKSFKRIAGAVNLTKGADFDRFSMFGGRRRCNVADDGTIVAWHGDPDYKEDGTMGQVMVYQPKFYYLVCPVVYDPIETGIGYHLRKANYYVSEKPRAGFRLHPAFYDANGNEIDYFLTSAYEGSIWDADGDAYLLQDEQVMNAGGDKFSSISGARPASGSTQGLTRTAIEQMAQNRGANWHGDLIKQVSAEQMLMIIEMGMMNLQTAIAQGVVTLPWETGMGDPDYKEDGTMGQVMVYQPKFYYLVCPVVYDPIETGIGYHLRKANYYVSEKPRAGFRLHPAFYDANGNEIDYFLTSAYEGSIWDADGDAYLLQDEQVMNAGGDKFSSISGARPASGSTQGLTRTAIEQMAQNRGANWHGDLIKQVSAEQMLMIIEMGMMNLQTAIAQGVVTLPWETGSDKTSSYAAVTGSTSGIGNGTGRAEGTITYEGGVAKEYAVDGKTSVCWRGKENFWGNIWKFVYGINIWGNGKMGGGQPYICSDFNFAENKNSGNYEGVGFTATNVAGYISAMGYSTICDWLFIASECTGNSSLPVGDYTYITQNLNGYRIARLGGGWSGGGDAGAFSWYLYYGVGGRVRNVGGRLVYIPTRDSAEYTAAIASWKEQMKKAA